jgi:hypothetical protein
LQQSVSGADAEEFGTDLQRIRSRILANGLLHLHLAQMRKNLTHYREFADGFRRGIAAICIWRRCGRVRHRLQRNCRGIAAPASGADAEEFDTDFREIAHGFCREIADGFCREIAEGLQQSASGADAEEFDTDYREIAGGFCREIAEKLQRDCSNLHLAQMRKNLAQRTENLQTDSCKRIAASASGADAEEFSTDCKEIGDGLQQLLHLQMQMRMRKNLAQITEKLQTD